MNLEDVILRNTRANQPAATDVAEATLYYVTDEGVTERSNGAVWQDWSDAGGGITQLTGDVTAGPGSGSQAATIANGAVSDAKLRDSAALSVIGRSVNSSGDPADIAAASDGEVLRRSGTSLGFGTVATAGIADEAVTYAKMQHVSAASRLLGRGSAGGAGDVEEVTLGSGLSMSGTTLSVAAAGALVLLAERVASASASLDFTSLITSTYDEYLIELINMVPATTNVELILRVSTNNGSSYDNGNNYNFAGLIVRQSVTSGVGGTGQTSFRITGGGTLVNTASLAGYSGTFRLFNPLSTSQRKAFVGHGFIAANDGNFYMISMGGQYESTANDIDAFQVLMSSGNITSGTVRLYGIAKP